MLRNSQSMSNVAPKAGPLEEWSAGVPHLLSEMMIGGKTYGDDPLGARQFEIPGDPECRLIALNDQHSAGAERFATLVSRLRYAQQRHSLRKLLVTSAIPGEGKTLMCTNIAIALAAHLQRTLLIDGDLRKPSVTNLLNIKSGAGLSDWWERREPVATSLVRAKQVPLWVLPAGKELEKPASLLQSSDFAELLNKMSLQFNWVIIDSPPLVPFADAATMSTLCDAIVLVTRRGCTPKKLLRDAIKSIDTKKIIATLLNDSPVSDQQYYQYYYKKHSYKALGSSLIEPGLKTTSNK
jgi:capsular exopolysaccharide synthesis family protein